MLRTCTPGDEYCAGTYEELQQMTGYADPFCPFQQTVETCALVICLWVCREELWDNYTQEEKDVIAVFLSSFAHAQAVLEYYAGDGWYRDGQCFEYYSCWAFNFYAPLWNRWYGYGHLPYVAKKFEENSNRLMESYADFFDRDGFVTMWGRSNSYRFTVVSAFDGDFYLDQPMAGPGVARRISSGALLQFLTREDFLWNGIPSMGIYGHWMHCQ